MYNEHVDYPGFFIIPGFPQHLISLTGDLLSIRTGKILKWSIWKPPTAKTNVTGGYRVANLYIESGVRKGISRHRAMALAFIPKPSDIFNKDLVVNHIDGIPGNDVLDNLEWCSRAANIKHAYDMGLHSKKTRSVVVKELVSGEEVRYPTIREAAVSLAIHESTLCGFLTRDSGAAYDHVHAIRYADDEWRRGYVRTAHLESAIKAYNCITEKILIFNTVAELARFIDLPEKSLNANYRRGSKNPYRGWIVRSLHDTRPLPKYTSYQKQMIRESKGTVGPSYFVEDLHSGEIGFYINTNAVIKFLDCSKIELQNKIQRQRPIKNRYIVQKYTLQSKVPPFSNERIVNSSN